MFDNKDGYCPKHKMYFGARLWCPMCLSDDAERYDEQYLYDAELENSQPDEENKCKTCPKLQTCNDDIC